MDFNHIPVLLSEVIKYLDIKSGGIYVDGTVGGGGHAYEIAKRIGLNGKLIGIDQDKSAITAAKARLNEYKGNIILVNDNFINIKNIVKSHGFGKVDGILLDLGVSSYQLDKEDRGFSYMKDAKLDMRMNMDTNLTAVDVVNNWTESEIAAILREYGEEKWAKRIASFICEERKIKQIETTFELVDVIKKAIPISARREGPHPAKRTFQAIRIAVNNELNILGGVIKDGIETLKPGGRMCIISFHSLEDRIVKSTFNELKNPCVCPPRLPKCVCGKVPLIKIVTKKVIVPKDEEINENPRSRSAKLRVAKRLGSIM